MREVPPCSDAPETGVLEYYYGCTDDSGREVIPFVHRRPILFTPSGFAVVEERFCGTRGGWYYLDAKYEQKFQAVADEGIPDAWLPEDPSIASTKLLKLVRYTKDGKYGYLDVRRGVVTAAQFGSAYRFANGKALVCTGCHPERWHQCAPAEAHCTGQAYFIDERGRRLDQEPDRSFHEYWWCRENPGEKYIPPADAYCN